MKKSKKSISALDSSFTDSGKKLVQARLPFKIIASPVVVATEEPKNDSKKRKLSFSDNEKPTKKICTSEIKENLSNCREPSPVLISDEDASSSDVPQPSSQEPALNPVVKLIKIDHMLENLEKLENAKHCPKSGKNQKGIIIKLPLTAKNKRKLSKSIEDKPSSDCSDVELVSDEVCGKKKATEEVNISKQTTEGQNKKSNSLMNYVQKVDKKEKVILLDKELSPSKANTPSQNENASSESDVVMLNENSSEEITSASQNSNSKQCSQESSKHDDNNSDDGLNTSIARSSQPSSSDLKLKALTPGQIKKAKEAEIKRLERQKLKEEKQKEKDEKERQRKKEKEEKEEQRKKEKEEKEKKRLAEIEAKNEEKRKKDEQKEEERKKKEDEKKKKEQEKEEAKNKNKKAAEAFTKFFVQSTKAQQKEVVYEDQNSNASDKFTKTKFMPFQIKGHMKLAPIYRRLLNKSSKEELDKILGDSDNAAPLDSLYISSLKSGKISPGKDSRTWLKDDSSSDIMIVEDELEGAGQTIDDVNKPPVQIFRAKFLSFHENQRPPYHGTWRKKSNFVKPRRPFATDKVYFDYEIDSDDEWEEEEPGESLNGSDDEKESEDEYEVDNDFFVPHGHLSDEELQNEDETEDNSPEAQKAKLKILQQEFAQEMNKKTEKIKPRLVGIIWQDENGNQPDSCPSVLWKSLSKRAMIYSNPIIVTEPEQPEEAGSPVVEKKQAKRPQLSNGLICELINLVHGNRHKKDFIIKEFLAFLTKSSTHTEFTRSIIKEKFDKIATWKIMHVETKKKKKKKCCWVISEDILKEHGLEELTVFNKWQYTLQPKQFLGEISEDLAKHEDEPCASDENKKTTTSKKKDAQNVKQIPAITKFTTVISKTNVEQLQTAASKNKLSKTTTETSEKKEVIKSQSAKTVKKRVPLLMSVPRGTAIPQSSKNALISKFLKKGSEVASKTSSAASEDDVAMEVDSIMID